MKIRSAFLILAVFAVSLLAVVFVLRSGKRAETGRQSSDAKKSTVSQPQTATLPAPVPAHYEQPPSPSSLGPTLSPEQFTGLTRDAYRAVKAIPQTIAQLPCYCHCDKSIGHKSLHSCFEDDHAAHCAVCVNEALTAYRLQTERKMTSAQIRQEIIAEYSNQ